MASWSRPPRPQRIQTLGWDNEGQRRKTRRCQYFGISLRRARRPKVKYNINSRDDINSNLHCQF